jgi:hypothetical protein
MIQFRRMASGAPIRLPGRGSGRSAGISDGNAGNRQRPDTAVNSQEVSHIRPELGIRYT